LQIQKPVVELEESYDVEDPASNKKILDSEINDTSVMQDKPRTDGEKVLNSIKEFFGISKKALPPIDTNNENLVIDEPHSPCVPVKMNTPRRTTSANPNLNSSFYSAKKSQKMSSVKEFIDPTKSCRMSKMASVKDLNSADSGHFKSSRMASVKDFQDDLILKEDNAAWNKSLSKFGPNQGMVEHADSREILSN
jgi:hypothetical protein